MIDFLDTALRGHRRVLEVGCGRGEVARELAGRGFDVTALDLKLHDVVEAPGVRFIEGDFLAHVDEPFDAVVFTSSLHHIAPLAEAIERAARLLRPGGRLVADEFDHEAPDVATLRWYYDVQELLIAAGAYPADRIDQGHGHGHGQGHGHGHEHGHGHDHGHGHGHGDVVARWRHAHEHEPRLHTGAEMLAAIAARFRLVETTRVPYLHRYIAHGTGPEIGDAVRTIEVRLVAQGLARPVGLRVVATPG